MKIQHLFSTVLALAVLAAPPSGALAQGRVGMDSTPPRGGVVETGLPEGESKDAGSRDFVMPHVLNAHEIAIPWFGHGLEKEIELPRWAPIHIGPLTIDLSPTKHVVMLLISASLCTLVLVIAGRGASRARAEARPSKGLAGAIEAMILYLRNDIILPNVGHHGEAYVPYCLTVFFMILFANLLGLVPYMATATGNIAVTSMLAIISFIVIEISGMRALGKGYLSTIFYWPHDLPLGIRAGITLIMTPVEILSKLTKPFALAMRLFANMTAGHVAVLSLIGMIFTFAELIRSGVGVAGTTAASVGLATGIMCLEVFVAFLQAFIFMLLTAVFIGQIRESHH